MMINSDGNGSAVAIRNVLPGITTASSSILLREAGDDAYVLREELERYFGLQIPDEKWSAFGAVAEAVNYCRHYAGSAMRESRSIMLGLPQMANRALSETWLLKEMGDMHWAMMSKGMGQPYTDFKDDAGNRLYAAFVRVRYAVGSLSRFKEHETLEMEGQLGRSGHQTYQSAISGGCVELDIKAELLTSFLVKRENDNARMLTGRPAMDNDLIAYTADATFFAEHRKMKKGLCDRILSGGHEFEMSDAALAVIVHPINPYLDINGVGLLYFACYPVIADECLSAFFRTEMPIADYERKWHTSFRDVFYFANCNDDDAIETRLNSVSFAGKDRIKVVMSMYRRSDKKLIARVLTVKEKAKE